VRLRATYPLVVAAAVLTVTACRKQPAPTVFVDPALATLVPVDAVFIAGIRVQQLQDTPAYQRYISAKKLPVVESFARKTGMDPRKNLWEVVIPSDGNSTWVMLRGKFAEMGMEPRVEREGAQRLGYKGYTLLGDARMAVLFLNPTTAIAAPPAALRGIIDNRDKGTGIPAWLNARVNTVSSTNQVWFAGKPGGWMPRQLAQHIDALSGGADFRSGMVARIVAYTHSDSDAHELRADLNRLVANARLLVPENTRRRLRLYDGIQIGIEGSILRVTVQVPSDLLDDAVVLFSDAAKHHNMW
jgi:hypothetical protein